MGNLDRSKKIAIVMGVYFLVCVLAMVWPGAVVANRIEPMVLGLPFFFFWYVLWIFVVFAGTVILYRWEYGGRE